MSPLTVARFASACVLGSIVAVLMNGCRDARAPSASKGLDAVAPAPSLAATFGPQGLTTLTYGGTKLVDVASNPSASFQVLDYALLSSNGSVSRLGAGSPSTTTWDSATQRLTQTFTWGVTTCTYALSGNTLTLNVEVKNLTSQTLAGINVYPLVLEGIANGFFTADTNTAGPTLIALNLGSSTVLLTNEQPAQSLYLGLKSTLVSTPGQVFFSSFQTADFQGSAFPVLNHAVAPGSSETYVISMRVGPPGSTSVSLASDLLRRYRDSFPSLLDWPSHRPIGALFLAGSPGASPTNPRRWFSDPLVDVITPSGLASFQQRLLAYADTSVQIAQSMGAQGIIVWDIEGQPDDGVDYICDPQQIGVVAPEMESLVGGVKLVDAFFKRFTDAGLRVGLCARPQTLHWNPPNSAQEWYPQDYPRIVTTLDAKIAYARQRWGATLYYVDSNDYFDAQAFRQVAQDNPGVLLIPEGQKDAHFGATAPYNDLTSVLSGQNGNRPRTPDEVKAIWPGAFQVIYNSTAGLLDTYASELVQGVRGGDILLYAGWYSGPELPTVRSLYQQAGVDLSDTTPPQVSLSAPSPGATVSGQVTLMADAHDDKGVLGVQFRVDGVDRGAEISVPPYQVSWDTTSVALGSHVLTAVVRDSGSNHTTSTPLTVQVSALGPGQGNPPGPADAGSPASNRPPGVVGGVGYSCSQSPGLFPWAALIWACCRRRITVRAAPASVAGKTLAADHPIPWRSSSSSSIGSVVGRWERRWK